MATAPVMASKSLLTPEEVLLNPSGSTAPAPAPDKKPQFKTPRAAFKNAKSHCEFFN